jgi:hypothetical protein
MMKKSFQPATTIDQVIAQLEDIIGWAEENASRLGYFAALYRKVTLLIQSGIENYDFDRINIILISQINTVQNELSLIWPLFRLFDIAAGRLDELLARFGILQARDQAWQVAEEISSKNPRQLNSAIREIDQRVYRLGKLIRNPGGILSVWLLLIRMGEIRTARRIIHVLK